MAISHPGIGFPTVPIFVFGMPGVPTTAAAVFSVIP